MEIPAELLQGTQEVMPYKESDNDQVRKSGTNSRSPPRRLISDQYQIPTVSSMEEKRSSHTNAAQKKPELPKDTSGSQAFMTQYPEGEEAAKQEKKQLKLSKENKEKSNKLKKCLSYLGIKE